MGIWQPVSVTRAPATPGSGYSLAWNRAGVVSDVHLYAHENPPPAPYLFYGHKDRFRYMNGRGEVYETNIIDPVRVLLLPNGQQRVNYVWGPVLFRKLHKVEWLFD